MSSAEKAALAEERLAACKKYMKVDYPDDDELICGFMDMADEYLAGAGCVREASPSMYDIICYAMTLNLYDGRASDAQQAAESVPKIARQFLTQLKLRCNYGEEAAADGSAGG
ncbi:MAG TPA: head-tail connector protein [Candidatus Agathobaculum intestinigallinarum]|nr:head-tail connector protein [Candidatus Agathobaculum intestinigallinarum]